MDANDAASYVQDLAGDNANIIFGAKFDETMTDAATITVIATGLENQAAKSKIMPDLRYNTAATAARPVAGMGLTRPAGGVPTGFGTTSTVQPTVNPTLNGIQRPRQPESTVQPVDIKIPDFLKNSRK